MNLAVVETQLRDRVGLDPASFGPNALARAVERRREVRQLSMTAYTSLLVADAGEWAAFLAELTVAETWFFRGGRALFDFLARGLPPQGRVLVVPCSTGEEAYSLAIALMESGSDVPIDAVDLVAGSVDRAERGVYPPFSFRERGCEPAAPHFARTGESWEVSDQLRAAVRFRTGNATDPAFLADEPPFDLILCRNLFIYLMPPARKRVMANLGRLLADGGRLCLTASEAEQLPAGRFVADGPPEFLVFRRAEVLSSPSPPARRGRGQARLPSAGEGDGPARGGKLSPLTRLADSPTSPGFAGREVEDPSQQPDPLAEARSRADAGDLPAARAACERAVKLRASADAFALLGVIHLAANRPADAIDAIRKALYLDPHHPDALEHMAVLCDQRGESERAASFRRRLKRVRAEDTA